jgi:hypothetical protein
MLETGNSNPCSFDGLSRTRPSTSEELFVRPRERILSNLEQIYRESYDQASKADDAVRMADLDNSYMRDQLMLEILLDIRDLFAVAPAAPTTSGKTALEQLAALRRLTGR